MAGPAVVGRIAIKVMPDLDGFWSELRTKLKAGVGRERIKIPASVDVDTALARAKLASLARNAGDINVGANLDTNRFRRAIAGLGNSGGGFGMAGGLLDPRVMAIVAAGAALAAPALALVSGALVALPGLASAAIAPLGAVALGFDGIRKAASSLDGPMAALKATVSEGFAQSLTPVFESLTPLFSTLSQAMPAITEGFGAIGKAVAGAITSEGGLGGISHAIGQIGQAMAAAGPGIQQFSAGMIKLVSESSGPLMGGLSGLMNQFGTAFSGWIDKITTIDPSTGLSTLGAAMSNLFPVIQQVGSALGGLVDRGLRMLADPSMANIQTVLGGVISALNGIVTVSQPLFTGLASVVAGIGATVSGVASAFHGVAGAVGAAASAIGSFVAAVSSGVGQAISVITSLPGQISAAVGSFAGVLVGAGKSLIQGLINGITSMAGAAISAARDIASKVADAVKGFLGIRSPSTLMAEVGVNVGQGLAMGIGSQVPTVAAAAQSLGSVIPSSLGAIAPSRMIGAGTDSIMAPVHQLQYDLGWSGKGLIPTLLDFGVNAGKQMLGGMADAGFSSMFNGAAGGGGGQSGPASTFNFNVANMDDAMQSYSTVQNRRSLQYAGR